MRTIVNSLTIKDMKSSTGVIFPDLEIKLAKVFPETQD
jgi:hypothetical protein